MPRPTRAKETRDATQRKMPATRYRGLFYVDPKYIPKGWTYRWFRESVLGQPDPQNITNRQMNGWVPVPADRHPDLVPPPLPGDEDKPQPKIIRRGGQILFQKPTEDFIEDREWAAQETMEAIEGIADFTTHANELMPRFNRSSPVQIERVIVRNKAEFQD